MKCQLLCSGKKKKNIINLSSAEFVQKVLMVNLYAVLGLIVQAIVYKCQNFLKVVVHVIIFDHCTQTAC